MSREVDHNDTDNKQPGGTPPGPASEGGPPRRTNNNNDKRKGETGNSTTGFRGNTEKMKGFVFELPTRNNQMTDTIDMLKRYARMTYVSAPSMGSLFLRVPKQPEIKRPGAKPIPTGEPEKEGGPPTITVFDTEIFKVEVSTYGKEVRGLERDLIAFFSVIFGQCSPSLRAELRSQDGFAEAELKGDCLWILAAIRGALTKFDKGSYVHEAIHDLWSRFYRDYQGPRSTVDYFNAFEALVKTLQENDAIGSPPLTQDPDPDVIGRDDNETQRNLRERALAVALIKNSDNHRFANLKDDLKTNYARGTDQWPKTLTGAYNLLVTHERHETNRPKPGRRGGGGGGGTGGKNKTGGGTGTGGPKGHQFAMTSSPPFPPGSILLDSESSESIFRDLSLLSNIRIGESPMTLYTNGGTRQATQQGEYNGLGKPLTVWVDTTSLANILALRDVRKLARVTLDTAEELALVVHLPNGELMRFVEHDDTGLYVYHPECNEVKVPVRAYTMLQTVSKNRTLFSRRELDGADAARALYRQVGRPSQSRFVEYLSKNLIRNCPVTIADAKRAAYIYGADPAFLKGKRTQKKALPHVPTTIPTPVPDFIADHHNDVTLCIDFFYVQGSIFFHAISRKIGFRTCLPVNNRSKTTILRALSKELRLYAQRGFTIRDVHADQAPTATEHWEKVLEANPVNKERLPPLLSRPPQPKWKKALEEAKQKALADFALQKGSVPDGIQKFCSLLPSCIGTYQGFHEDKSTKFLGATCHCPLSPEFSSTWEALLPDVKLPTCRKADAMNPFGLTQHLEMSVTKKGYGDHHKVTLLFLEALYRDPPPKYKGNTKAWHAHPGFFKPNSAAFSEAMKHYIPSNQMVGRYSGSNLDKKKPPPEPPSTTSSKLPPPSTAPSAAAVQPIPDHHGSNLKKPPPIASSSAAVQPIPDHHGSNLKKSPPITASSAAVQPIPDHHGSNLRKPPPITASSAAVLPIPDQHFSHLKKPPPSTVHTIMGAP